MERARNVGATKIKGGLAVVKWREKRTNPDTSVVWPDDSEMQS